jgi:hypothetical protein
MFLSWVFKSTGPSKEILDEGLTVHTCTHTHWHNLKAAYNHPYSRLKDFPPPNPNSI